jgi:acid phosphatase
MSFIPIQKHGCENIVPANQFAEDLQNNALPNYMFYSPDLDHDGHDPANNPKIGLVKASAWLKSFLDPLLQHQAFVKDTLIIITFDESGKGPNDTNHIYTVFLGDMVNPGKYEGNYTHYNLLRTIEENFGLGTLADGDSRAKPISGVWKQANPI